MLRRHKNAPLRVCDYEDCLERATFEHAGTFACAEHRDELAARGNTQNDAAGETFETR